jgi:dihydroorotate dehydrogenase
MGLYSLAKPILFALEPERAHRCVMFAASALADVPGFAAGLRAAYGFEHPALRVRLWGRELPNPVGLAAGFDKDGEWIAPLAGLGFGYVEVGTVTPLAQPGDPRPRLFRLPEDGALVNRMGFNNRGLEALASRLARVPRPAAWIGVNLGRQRDTPNERALEDYLAGLRALYRHADYFVINVSSPNTPGLRELQDRASLLGLAWGLRAERERVAEAAGRRTPLLVKLAPDLDEAGLADAAAVAEEAGLDGLIATNTTVRRPGLRSPHRDEAGGLSGRPLFPMALAAVRTLRRLTQGRLPVIGVGGIFGAEDAYAMIRAGASAVQVYTGLIYRGPGLVKEIKQGLVRLLERDGFSNVSEAVGVDVDGGRSAEAAVTRQTAGAHA